MGLQPIHPLQRCADAALCGFCHDRTVGKIAFALRFDKLSICYVWLLRDLAGRTGTAVVPTFVQFPAALFLYEVDVQAGNGRLNYINGYVAKDCVMVVFLKSQYFKK